MKRHLTHLISLLVVSGTLAACAANTQTVAQSYAEGQTAFQQKNYSKAYSQLMLAAQAGDNNAQYAVGYMLYNGLGTQQDQATALTWFKKAAKHGNYRAIAAMQKLDQQAERAMYNLPEPKKK